MSENSKIEWTDHTFNPWIGCTKVSPGCDHCYAENLMDTRMGKVVWGAGQSRERTKPANWNKPVQWNAKHDAFFAAHGRRQRVFCSSLADVFDNEVPQLWRTALFALIYDTPNLDWLLLTKRIGNAAVMLKNDAPEGIDIGSLPNLWIGATIVNQEEADRDIPKLLRTPAAVRFLSMEPLLGPVNLDRHLWKCCGTPISGHTGDGWMQPPDPPECCADREPADMLHWVIVGGESGNQARPMSIQWARSLRDQCSAANVQFLFKQWGEWAPAGSKPSGTPGRYAFGDYEHGPALFTEVEGYPHQIEKFGARCVLERVGKQKAGRLLDGVQHDGYPEVA
jgi:protein gp37